MKIALIGATGFVGTNLVNELSGRGHEVTAIARNPKNEGPANVKWQQADIFETNALAQVLKGHDVVISAYNPGWTNPNIYTDFLKGAQSIQEAVKQSGVKRYITIGGAGSLYIAPGIQLIDTPEFPADIKPGALAAKEYLDIIKEEKDLDWAFVSPAIEMHPGIDTGRTGKYRLGLDNPVFDDNGRSILSGQDLAVVIADEAENPKHHQQRFTAAY